MLLKVPYNVKHGTWKDLHKQYDDNTFICDLCKKRKKNDKDEVMNYVGIAICADCYKKNKGRKL